jgi:hypothetical protein
MMLFGGVAELRSTMCPLLFTGKAKKGHFILQCSQPSKGRKFWQKSEYRM